MILLIPNYIWYADHVDDWSNLAGDNTQNWQSTVCDPTACTLANREFTLSTANVETINPIVGTPDTHLWDSPSNGVNIDDIAHPSSWCTTGDPGCDNTKVNNFPKKFIQGEEVQVLVTGVYKDLQYI